MIRMVAEHLAGLRLRLMTMGVEQQLELGACVSILGALLFALCLVRGWTGGALTGMVWMTSGAVAMFHAVVFR